MRFQLFDPYPQLHSGLSERLDGPMNLVATAPNFDLAFCEQNRRRFFLREGIKYYVLARSEHGINVAPVDKVHNRRVLEKTDSLATCQSELFLALTVADCVPIYFYDPEHNVVALAHGGWRGVAAGIVSNTLSVMFATFATKPAEVLMCLGPGLQKHHYEIRQDVVEKFANFSRCVSEKDGKFFLDLPQAIVTESRSSGVVSDHIEVSHLCTFCENRRFFSYRGDRPSALQTMLAFAGTRQ